MSGCITLVVIVVVVVAASGSAHFILGKEVADVLVVGVWGRGRVVHGDVVCVAV